MVHAAKYCYKYCIEKLYEFKWIYSNKTNSVNSHEKTSETNYIN